MYGSENTKAYGEVLSVARDVVKEAIAEAKDGVQLKDVVQIVRDNFSAALEAFKDRKDIVPEWKAFEAECVAATSDFAVDVACDALKVPEAEGSVEFKETQELVAAVQGIVGSVIAHLPGGFQAAEILPVVFENFDKIAVGIEGVDKIGLELKGNIRAGLKLIAGFAVQTVFGVRKSFLPAQA